MSILSIRGFRYIVLLILNPRPNRNLTSQGHLLSVNSLVNICLIHYIYVKWQCKGINISSSNADFIKRGFFFLSVSLIYSFHLLFFLGITSTCWPDNWNGSSHEESHWNWWATGLQGTGTNISTWSKF